MINFDNVPITETAHRRAELAGFKLDQLRDSAPEQFMLFCSEPVLWISEGLKDLGSSVFFAAFPHHRLFEQKEPKGLSLKAFPALAEVEEEKLLSALSRLIQHPKFAYPQAYLRTVNDKLGKRHYFALPLNPDTWQGELNQLIGPFASSSEAEIWAEHNLTAGLTVDTILHAEKWFCEFFSAV